MTSGILLCEVSDVSEDDLSLFLDATSGIVFHTYYLNILLQTIVNYD